MKCFSPYAGSDAGGQKLALEKSWWFVLIFVKIDQRIQRKPLGELNVRRSVLETERAQWVEEQHYEFACASRFCDHISPQMRGDRWTGV